MPAESPAQAGLFVCVLHGKAAMHLEERRQPRSWHQWNRRCRCNQLDHLLRGLCRSYKMDALPGKPLPSMARHYSPLPFAQRRGGLGRGGSSQGKSRLKQRLWERRQPRSRWLIRCWIWRCSMMPASRLTLLPQSLRCCCVAGKASAEHGSALRSLPFAQRRGGLGRGSFSRGKEKPRLRGVFLNHATAGINRPGSAARRCRRRRWCSPSPSFRWQNAAGSAGRRPWGRCRTGPGRRTAARRPRRRSGCG